MSGIMQMFIGILSGLPRAKIADTGIAELYYTRPNHLLTTNKGLSWSSTGTSGETYGGMSSGDVLLHNPGSGHKKFNFDFSSTVDLGSTSSTSRYHVNPNTGTIMRQIYDNIQRSTDGGVTWTTVHTRSPASSFSNGFHYGGGVWFHNYTYTDATRVVYSLRSTDDGLTWSSSGITGIPNATGFAGHSFYANGYHYLWHPNGYVYRSPNALTWTQISTTRYGWTSNYGQENLPFYRDGYIYVISGNQIYRSADAITWSAFGNPITANSTSWRSLGYINGNWVILAGATDYANYDYTYIYTSSDNATTWTQRYSSLTVLNGGALYIKNVYGLNQHYTL